MSVALNSAVIRVSRTDDGVRLLEMQDVAGRNAFSDAFLDQLQARLGEVARDPEARVLVLAGSPEVFSSGASLELLRRFANGDASPADLVVAKTVLDMPIPVIAAMEGHATGGGLALGLCADIVVMARESRYGCSAMNMGFTPAMGLTRLFEHVLSPAVAAELLLTGEHRRGSDFAGVSGVNYVLPRERVRAKAEDLSLRIAEKPRVALVALKRVLSIRRRQAFEEARTLEALMHGVTLCQPDIRARMEESYAR